MPSLSSAEPPETGSGLNLVPSCAAAADLVDRGRSGSGSDCGFYRPAKEPTRPPSPAESSSIGMNSDEEREDEEDDEIQGPLRGELNASMESLEEALPMRRGISSFYDGKSKSFASLADASSSTSIKAIVKPETPYSRKRRNLLAYTLLSENGHHHKSTKTSHLNVTNGGISKKPASYVSPSASSRANLALALAMANSNTSTNTSKANAGACTSTPLSLRSSCHWRSFSLVDLQQCQPAVSSKLRSLDDIS